MGNLITKQGEYEYLWASDVEFDGILLEVYDNGGGHWFDIAVSERGELTVNTFSREVPVEVLLNAISVAQEKT